MSTAYEKKYPTFIVPTPTDVKDGSHSVASIEASLRTEAEKLVTAAQNTGTSCYDDGTPHAPEVA